jgi:GTP-binding protein
VKKTLRETFGQMITDYLKNRRNLMQTFLLIDLRLEPQKIDLEFMGWMAENRLPFVILFTKADKLGKNKMQWQADDYKTKLLEFWEELPPAIITSAVDHTGKNEVLKTVEETNLLFMENLK